MRTASIFSLLFLFFLFLFLLPGITRAQSKYWVSFKDKPDTNFDANAFFETKTLENRKMNQLPITDWYDLPVNKSYISTIISMVDSTGYSSRWLNGMAIFTNASNLEKLRQLSFVSDVSPMHLFGSPASDSASKRNPEEEMEKVCEQIEGLQGKQFAYHKLTGKGIRIAILDVGFKNVNVHPAFSFLRENKGILLTYDFLHHKENVYNYGAHGTAVLSCIAGKYGIEDMGLAPDAEFLLARTEREGSEFIDEEDAWVAAAEWAEQHGARIISCSLGYTYQRYFYHDMNGKTSIVARAATAAARKGLLVCVAAGNEGNSNWKYLSTPADADSVLTVGGYDPSTHFHIGFSSFGPSADGRVKPNIIASGTAWVALPEKFGYESGTSFATPLMAGFAACLWQKMPTATNMEILDLIEKSGSLYPYFDFAHGYGIAQAGNLFHKKEVNDSSFTLYRDQNVFKISINASYFKDSFQIENKLRKRYTYVKISDEAGRIMKYQVIKVESQVFELKNISDYILENHDPDLENDLFESILHKGWTITASFDGCIRTLKL